MSKGHNTTKEVGYQEANKEVSKMRSSLTTITVLSGVMTNSKEMSLESNKQMNILKIKLIQNQDIPGIRNLLFDTN